MAKSAKKNSDKKQTKITQKWVLKDSEDITSKKNVPEQSNARTTRQSLKRKANNSIGSLEKEHDSVDNEVIKSSQDTKETGLRKNIPKTMRIRATTPKSVSQNSSLDSVIDKLSISEKETNEIYENISDKESIEMTHDLNTLIVSNEVPSNILVNSPIKDNTDRVNSELKNDFQANESLEHPLEREKNSEKNPKISQTNKDKKKTKTTLKIMTKKKKSCNSNKMNPGISPVLLKKLKNLKIQLQHEVPPQHLLSDDLTFRSMNKEQTLAFETYGPLKKGLYSENEDVIIKKNWENFCEIHKWNPKIVEPFINLKHTNNTIFYIPSKCQRRYFVQFLANGLPWRSLYSVYLRFKNLYSDKFNTGKFTAEDDLFIMKFIANAPENNIKFCFTELAKKMNRKTMSVWHHFQKLKQKYGLRDFEVRMNSNNKKRYRKPIELNFIRNKVVTNVKWTYPVVRKFLDVLLTIVNSKDIETLKDKEFDQKIWKQLEDEINIDCFVLKNFWYLQLHMQLFCPKPIYLNDFKIKFIKYLYEKQIKEIKEIQWKTVCIDFDGTTPLFLSLLFNTLVKYAKERINSEDLYEIINFLYNNHIPELIDRKTDAVLPTLDQKLRSTFIISENRVPNSILKSSLDYDNYYNLKK